MTEVKKQGLVKRQRVAPVKVVRTRELRRVMTPAEAQLWSWLRSGRVQGYRFRRQQVIEGFIVDFYCHQAALVVEVDGQVHEQKPEYDLERDVVLSARGLRVLRFSNDEVLRNLRAVVAEIEANLPAREDLTPGPSPAGRGE